ncbi:unnamed protein product [Amoebophrya sp. A25]|nr:unnamed protein product [Amoebophrya sp. A25]|eukprot:GSA25T00003468001.1
MIVFAVLLDRFHQLYQLVYGCYFVLRYAPTAGAGAAGWEEHTSQTESEIEEDVDEIDHEEEDITGATSTGSSGGTSSSGSIQENHEQEQKTTTPRQRTTAEKRENRDCEEAIARRVVRYLRWEVFGVRRIFNVFLLYYFWLVLVAFVYITSMADWRGFPVIHRLLVGGRRVNRGRRSTSGKNRSSSSSGGRTSSKSKKDLRLSGPATTEALFTPGRGPHSMRLPVGLPAASFLEQDAHGGVGVGVVGHHVLGGDDQVLFDEEQIMEEKMNFREAQSRRRPPTSSSRTRGEVKRPRRFRRRTEQGGQRQEDAEIEEEQDKQRTDDGEVEQIVVTVDDTSYVITSHDPSVTNPFQAGSTSANAAGGMSRAHRLKTRHLLDEERSLKRQLLEKNQHQGSSQQVGGFFPFGQHNIPFGSSLLSFGEGRWKCFVALIGYLVMSLAGPIYVAAGQLDREGKMLETMLDSSFMILTVSFLGTTWGVAELAVQQLHGGHR